MVEREESILIRGAYVLSMDERVGDLVVADILIEDGAITKVDAHIDAEATVIDGCGKLATPGLVDTHLHLWQTALRGMTAELWSKEYFNIVHPMSQYYRPEDMYWATYAGALELIDHGVTSVFDYCHSTNSPDHARASLRGLDDAGIRARFGFGMFEREVTSYRDRSARLHDLRTLQTERRGSASLTELAVAVDHDVKFDAVECARELGIPVSIHGNPLGLISAFDDAGLLADDLLWVHCNGATDAELMRLVESGAHLSLTPDIEMGMGKPVAIFERATRAGISVSLGVDVTSYASPDILTQMRLAYALQRVLDGAAEREHGHMPPLRTATRPTLSARDVVTWATVNGAAGLGFSDRVGSISPGKRADIVLFETEPFGMSVGDPAAHLVLQASAGNIDTVIIDGRIRKRDGRLLDIDGGQISAALYASREHLLGGRGYGERIADRLRR